MPRTERCPRKQHGERIHAVLQFAKAAVSAEDWWASSRRRVGLDDGVVRRMRPTDASEAERAPSRAAVKDQR